MTLEAREYFTEGHRLLCESAFSPAEIAKLSGQPRQRVSEWRTGRKRPADEARAALERAVGIPARTWEQPPTRREPLPAPPAAAAAAAQAEPGTPTVRAEASGGAPGAPGVSGTVPDVDRMDLPTLGLPALERLASRLRALEPSLPPRERVSALQAEARVLAVHEQLRQREADARDEFLASPEFRADVRSIVSALTDLDSGALRDRLARLGVSLPAPAPTSAPVELGPPTEPEDVDALVRELEVSRRFRDGGEPELARAHTAALAIDVHADAIASLVVDDAARAARVLELVDATDERILSTALARAMAVRDVRALSDEVRTVVAQLLELVGQEPLARQIGA